MIEKGDKIFSESKREWRRVNCSMTKEKDRVTAGPWGSEGIKVF